LENKKDPHATIREGFEESQLGERSLFIGLFITFLTLASKSIGNPASRKLSKAKEIALEFDSKRQDQVALKQVSLSSVLMLSLPTYTVMSGKGSESISMCVVELEPRIYPDESVAVWAQDNSPRVMNPLNLTSPLVPSSIEKSFSTLPIGAVNFDTRVVSIAPESPKPTVFLDGKGNLLLNQPTGQQEYLNDIPDPDEGHMEGATSECRRRNEASDVIVVNDGDNDGEIPRFKSKATQARKRTIVISDDEEVDKGIRILFVQWRLNPFI